MSTMSPSPTLAVAALPMRGAFASRRVREAVLLVGAIALLSLAARTSFSVPFSADRTGKLVPITGQTFGVLFIAISLGARRAVAAVSGYLAIGLLGAPVYAAGASGAILFTGATAGFLWGFLLASAVVGWLADRKLDRGPWLFATLLVGNACIYAVGLPVLGLWLRSHNIPLSVWDAGLWPFIPGDLAKLLAAAVAVPGGWAILDRVKNTRR